MIASKVRDILIPLADYPHLTRSATVHDAFDLLCRSDLAAGWRYRHVLVFDEEQTLLGVAGLHDLLRALMPEYLKTSVMEHYSGVAGEESSLSLIWQESFEAQCQQVGQTSVAACATPVTTTVKSDDPVARAAYLMAAHNLNMLPVLEGPQVVGVVRIVDVFNLAAEAMNHV